MSKRGAEEYITKEHGSTPNSVDSQKVKMATAAQLAKRKMAMPKSRQRTGQSPLPGAGASNPFTSTSTFGAPQNGQQGAQSAGGFSFGASQSFPPTDAGANNGFSFNVPGQSTSFTFGQDTTNNPFASLNGTSNDIQQPNQESGDTMMESPQKKPAFGSSVFGGNDSVSSTPSSGFTFGQSTSQSASQPLFATSQNTGFGGTSSTPLFGQAQGKPQESKADASLFGQSGQPQNSTPPSNTLFGQSAAATQKQPASTGFSFGQSTTAAPSSSTFSFGQPSTSVPSSAPTFSFGNVAKQPASDGALFGGLTPSGQTSLNSSTPASQPASQPTSSTSLFGAVNGTSSTNNVFGGFGGSKSVSPPKSSEIAPAVEEPKKFVFGQPIPSSTNDVSKTQTTSEQSKANPFAGLFGQTSSEKADASLAPSAKPSTSGFSFAAPSQPNGLFATTNSAEKAAETPKKPSFSFGTTPAAVPSSTPKPAEAPASTNPFAGLFGNKSQATEQKSEKPLFGTVPDTNVKGNESKSAFSFGQTSSTPPTAPGASVKTLFGGFGTQQPSVPSTSQKKPVETPAPQVEAKSATTFGSFTPSKPAETSTSAPDFLTQSIDAATSSTRAESAIHKQKTTGDGSVRSVNTHPPTRIPPYLNGDDYKSYDSNYRLHSLNREFQKRIASLDPSQYDFENIIHNYVAARESIGESIGLSTRNIAGSKRKADDQNNQESIDNQSAKRTKQVDNNVLKPAFGTSQTSASVFQSVPSSKTSTSFIPPSSAPASTSLSSNSSTLFSSMIPNNDKASSAQPSTNPFANLAKPAAPAASDSTSSKPTSLFSSATHITDAAGSTTPTKSPPKKPAFEMPKFMAPTGGVNFMDAFKKQSEVSSAKLAKDAKEKRKLEEFDSDEDDEEEWEKNYEEEERAKKAKLADVASKGFTPVFASAPKTSETTSFKFGAPTHASTTTPKPFAGFGIGSTQNPGKSSNKPIDISDNDASGEDDDQETNGDSGDGTNDDAEADEDEDDEEDDLPEDDVDGEDENEEEEEDIETTLANSRGKGGSLFDRVTSSPGQPQNSNPNTSVTKSVEKDPQIKKAAFGNIFGQGTPEAPTFSPLTPSSSKEPYVPSKTFNFTPVSSTTTTNPIPGASIFSGGTIKEGPVFGEGLFGSRPSTPSNADKPKTNLFANLGTPSTATTDHTWKKGSEIKFGSSTTDAPSVNVTAPTPRKNESNAFSSLFGASNSASNSSTDAGVGFSFGQSPVPGFLAAASHLTGGSGTNSGMSSRATSPGTTDNESVATNEEDYANDDQVSLMETRPGEENEETISEVRARAMRFYSKDQIAGTKLTVGWNVVGLGTARILRNKATTKSRIVVRADPGANVLLNANLQPDFKYEYAPVGSAGTVKFNVVTPEGLQGWTLKVKTQQMGKDLAKVMEENKQSGQ